MARVLVSSFLILVFSVPAFAERNLYSSFDIEKIKDKREKQFVATINVIHNICRGYASEFWRLKSLRDGKDPCMDRGIELLKTHDGKRNIITSLCEDKDLVDASRRHGSYGGRYDKDGSTERRTIERCKSEARRSLAWDQMGNHRTFYDEPFPPLPVRNATNPEQSLDISDEVIDAMFKGCVMRGYFVAGSKGCLKRFLKSYYDPDTSKLASSVYQACGVEGDRAKVRPENEPRRNTYRGEGGWDFREYCFSTMSQLIEGPFFTRVQNACKDFKPKTRQTLPSAVSSTIEAVGTPVATVARTTTNVANEVIGRGGEVLGNAASIGLMPLQLIASTVLTGEPSVSAPPGFKPLRSPIEVVEIKGVGEVVDNAGVRPYDCYLANYQKFYISDVQSTRARAATLASQKEDLESTSTAQGSEKILPSATEAQSASGDRRPVASKGESSATSGE